MGARRLPNANIFAILIFSFLIACGVTLYILQTDTIQIEAEKQHEDEFKEVGKSTETVHDRQFPRSILADVGRFEINLSGLGISETIPAEIRQLSSLRVLDVSDNSMTNLPAEIGQLSELRILDVSNNKLTGIPHEIGSLKKLEVLDVSGNQVSEYDLEIIRAQLPESTRIIR